MGFAFLNAVGHFIEHRSSRPLGRLLLDQDINDIDIVLTSELPKLGSLIGNRTNLT
ncbi:hypothetical protein HED60_01400 [Planctomycetales bacterium ZRK34]|nr:hypothetical protein HED60_01400 [Planctomycetales bacterium ZRK34]